MSEAPMIMGLAKSNAAYRRAMESNPRYMRALKIREQALAARLKLPGVEPQPESPINADVSLDAWLDARVSADSAERAREVKQLALRALLRDCDAEIVTAATVYPDRIVRHLADEFAEFLEEAGTVVRRCGGASNAGEAVAVGDEAVAAWRALPALRARYDEIRAAQTEVMKADHVRRQNSQSPVFADPLASDFVASNWDDVFPAWRERDRTTYVYGAPERRSGVRGR